MADLLDLDKARKELRSKDLLAIERDTAITWGGRAGASYGNVLDEADHAEGMRWFWEAETYRAEAIEHAAMTEAARFVARLTAEVERHRAEARDHLVRAGHSYVKGGRTPKVKRIQRPRRSTRTLASGNHRNVARSPRP
ncbi:MAG: hypothetical protein ACYC2H_05940 [Thermoplasmatota archaeon]